MTTVPTWAQVRDRLDAIERQFSELGKAADVRIRLLEIRVTSVEDSSAGKAETLEALRERPTWADLRAVFSIVMDHCSEQVSVDGCCVEAAIDDMTRTIADRIAASRSVATPHMEQKGSGAPTGSQPDHGTQRGHYGAPEPALTWKDLQPHMDKAVAETAPMSYRYEQPVAKAPDEPPCPVCKGKRWVVTGRDTIGPCHTCHGTGTQAKEQPSCPVCGGNELVWSNGAISGYKPCPKCQQNQSPSVASADTPGPLTRSSKTSTTERLTSDDASTGSTKAHSGTSACETADTASAPSSAAELRDAVEELTTARDAWVRWVGENAEKERDAGGDMYKATDSVQAAASRAVEEIQSMHKRVDDRIVELEAQRDSLRAEAGSAQTDRAEWQRMWKAANQRAEQAEAERDKAVEKSKWYDGKLVIENLRLHRELDEAVAILRNNEWNAYAHGGSPSCLVCGPARGWKGPEHSKTCHVPAILARHPDAAQGGGG